MARLREPECLTLNDSGQRVGISRQCIGRILEGSG